MEILKVIQTIGTVLEIAKPVIETICTKLTPGMKEFAGRLYELSEKYPSLEAWAETIDKAADLLADALYAVGIVTDPADELGAKARKAEKEASDFESVEDYISYLRDEIRLDEGEMENFSKEERVACQITGLAVEAEALCEKLDVDLSADVVLLLSKIKNISDIVITAKDIISIITSLKDEGIARMDDVCDYIEGKGDIDRVKTGKIVKDVFEKQFDKAGEDIIEKAKMDVRRN